MPETTPPTTKIAIDFTQNGKVITSHPASIRAEGDLIGAIAKAYERLRREHPGISAFDVDMLVRKST
jgi:hypothetical protein